VFMGDLTSNDQTNLYSVPILGGMRRSLAGDIVEFGDVTSFKISPDSAHVVFTGTIQTANLAELFSAPISGGSRVVLSGTTPPNIGVTGFQISPDSARVVFRAGRNVGLFYDLYSAPIATSAPIKIAVEPAVVEISADSTFAIYLSEQGLYRTSITSNSAAPTPLSGLLAQFSDILNFRMSPDQSRVIFRADIDTDNVFELYRVQIGGKALTMDFDGDDRILADTDLLMLIRRHLGASGAAVSSGATSANATISSASTIQSRIDAVRNDMAGINRPLDVDLSGSIGASTDLVMLIRYALGFRGSAITQGALGSGAQRTNPTAIENHIRMLFTTYQLSSQG
jgi:hypothetical protein